MEIEEIIRLHNHKLEEEAGKDPFLPQRVKARLNNRSEQNRKSPVRLTTRSLLVYSLLLIVFTVMNFMLIDSLKTRERETITLQSVAFNINALESLEASYPGSISRAYSEVMK